jgi:hypothetical protein
MDCPTLSAAEMAKNIRLDSRNIKVKLGIVPSEDVKKHMLQVLTQCAEAPDNPADINFATVSGSGPELILTVDEAIEFLQKLKFNQ